MANYPHGNPPDYSNFMFSNTGHMEVNTNTLLTRLDDIESRIENLRSHASELSSQQQAITEALASISEASSSMVLAAGNKEEIESTINRLMMRILSVNIAVNIPRTPAQAEAFTAVKLMINQLLEKLLQNMAECRTLLLSYFNACSSESHGTVDPKFQAAILCCTLDDQKSIRLCLTNLIDAYKDIDQKLAQVFKKECKF